MRIPGQRRGIQPEPLDGARAVEYASGGRIAATRGSSRSPQVRLAAEEHGEAIKTTWRLLSWGLFGAFLVAAGLNMTGTAAGFATNHLADLVGPAWLYIAFRGLAEPPTDNRLRRLLGATPERAATVLFLGSTATEMTQIFWPTGLFSGRFDPLDIGAFGLGILPLYLMDKRLGVSRKAAGAPQSP